MLRIQPLYDVIAFDFDINKILELPFVGAKKLFKRTKIPGVPGLNPDLFPCHRVQSIVQSYLEYLWPVHVSCKCTTLLAKSTDSDTTTWSTKSCIFYRFALIQELFDNCVSIKK